MIKERLLKWGYDLLTSSTEARAIRNALSGVPRTAKVLDVGCGFGDKVKLLQSLGFVDFVGVEKNPHTAQCMVREGLLVLEPEEFSRKAQAKSFDLIVLSHIIEHFQYDELRKFLEHYFAFLRPGGFILIVTPNLRDAFYNDFDHVKPYNPQALNSVFVNGETQVQSSSAFRLKLIDFFFRKSPFLLFFPYRGHVLGRRNIVIDGLNAVMAMLFWSTNGVLGKSTGWVALYQLQAAGSRSLPENPVDGRGPDSRPGTPRSLLPLSPPSLSDGRGRFVRSPTAPPVRTGSAR
jgi:SAM-dependent methyltransferase